MKKILLIIPIILFMAGCSLSNTPSSQVDNLMNKYQMVDEDIKSGIDNVIAEQNMSNELSDRYREIINKQYKGLSYEIKDEVIDGDNAVITTEITVINLKKSIEDLVFDSSIYTKESYDLEKIKRLEEAKDKVKYTIDFELTKNRYGEWQLDALTNEELKKIMGMY